MERDLSLIRQILLRVEAMASRTESVDWNVDGYSEKTVVYNLDLAIKAGLVEGRVRWAADDDNYYLVHVTSLTWEGHDFLDSVRQEEVWNTARETVENAGHHIAQVSIGLIKELAVSVMRNQFGLSG